MKLDNNFFKRKFNGITNNPYFIAEIGVNHNGKMNLAKKMIKAAKKSKADAVKFQTFKAENLVSPNTPKVRYQRRHTSNKETHFQMLKSLELTEKMHYELINFCRKIKIDFISTPYGLDEAKFLNKLGCKVFKTASADLVDLEMHEYLAKKNKIVIISVGMASINEVAECIKIYRKYKNNKFILLHCVSNYPCSINSLNLNVLNTLKNKFNCEIGYSDHSVGNEAAMLSLALGARVIEKHFTINRKLKGPDQSASVLPGEFLDLVNKVAMSKIILGKNIKACQKEEREMSLVSRKSLTLNRELKKGSIMKKEYLNLKRPGLGLYYIDIKKILGKKIKRSLKRYYQPNLKDFY